MRAQLSDLERIVGPDAVLAGDSAQPFLHDATESRGLIGHALAVVMPADAAQVAGVLAWCYAHDVPLVPRGGGTGYAGGAVPVSGGVVVAMERMRRIRSFDPLLWRMHVEAGVTTAEVQRLARESGLRFPPDPGAPEVSQIGGNVATNAGGPHAFKYGVTGHWVTGVEAVVAPGEVVTFGGPLRKDVAGYDLRGLMVGSEGTLGVVTSVWLRLIPAAEAALPVLAFFDNTGSGCDAIRALLASGAVPAAIECLDAGALAVVTGACPFPVPDAARFAVLTEADGSRREAVEGRDALIEVLTDRALALHAPDEAAARDALWRWRGALSTATVTAHGGKVSEDIVVPLDRIDEAIEATVEIGRRHGLEACSYGHAGDGNLHCTFMIPLDETERAGAAADELASVATALGGSISGEHGLGVVKSGRLGRQWAPAAVELHSTVKRAFDPHGLINPGKKAP